MENCRVCLRNLESPVPLNDEDKQKFLLITGVTLDNVTEEFLCKRCSKLLLVSWNFRLEAINADDWFRKDDLLASDDFKSEVPIEEVEEEVLEAMPLKVDKKDNPFICDLCGSQFSCYRKILTHIRMHRKELGRFCRFCDKVFENRSQMSHHERKHIKKANRVSSSYVCENCGKNYSNLRQLQMHARTHMDSYKCTLPGCSDAFTQKRAFYGHFATKHGIKQPCVCADCGNTFSNHLTLKNHRRLFHDEGIKFSCPECPKTCLNQGQLDSHIVSSIGTNILFPNVKITLSFKYRPLDTEENDNTDAVSVQKPTVVPRI